MSSAREMLIELLKWVPREALGDAPTQWTGKRFYYDRNTVAEIVEACAGVADEAWYSEAAPSGDPGDSIRACLKEAGDAR